MLRVTPLQGGTSEDRAPLALAPTSTLIEYGGVRVLVNVGWDERSGDLRKNNDGNDDDDADLTQLPHVVLLTHSTLGAMGGLARYYRRHKTNMPPIYATHPTVKMGQMTLYEFHANTCLDGGHPGYSLEDVDAVCSSIQTLKYSQTLLVPSSSASISSPNHTKTVAKLGITAHRAGHTTGGAFFVLQRLVDETQVVVAPLYHHAREKHLDSASLLKFGAASDVLVCRPGGPPSKSLLAELYLTKKLPPPLVSRSEQELMDACIMPTLRRDGSVLIPVDASGRVLELLYLFHQYWERHRLGGAYELCWVGPMAWNTLEFARSQLEWMAAPLGQQFDSQRGHPYALPHVHMFATSKECLTHLSSRSNSGKSCVILASGASLESGPARDLLLHKFADNPDNAIVLTDSTRCVPRSPTTATPSSETTPSSTDTIPPTRTSSSSTPTTSLDALSSQDSVSGVGGKGKSVGRRREEEEQHQQSQSTAAQLLEQWCRSKLEGEEMPDVVTVDIPQTQRAPLAGRELQAFVAEEERARRALAKQRQQQAMLAEVELAKGRLRLLDDSTKDEPPNSSQQESTTSSNTQTTPKAPSTQPPPKKKSRFDSNLFLKFSKPIHMTFEVREEAVGIGQDDSVAKYGIGESVGRAGEVLEDDYGIAVMPDHFVDIVTGIDPSKYGGRIGTGLGFGADGRPVLAAPPSAMGGAKTLHSNSNNTNANNPEDHDAVAALENEDEEALENADLSEGNGIIRGRNGRPPMKVSTTIRRLEILAEIMYVPLEGLVDARAARQSVRALQPRQVVILGQDRQKKKKTQQASKEKGGFFTGEAALLADAVRSLTIAKEDDNGNDKMRDTIFAPNDGDTAELNVGHAAYSVRLIDTPYQKKRKTDEDGNESLSSSSSTEQEEEPESIEPFEAQMGECTVSLLDCVATGQKVALDGSLVLAPHAPSARQQKQKQKERNIMVSDGDVLLTDLRSEVIAQGMKADYSARAGYSQLVVNGKILVKKDQASGKISVEGPLSQDFFTVRSVVCAQYVIL